MPKKLGAIQWKEPSTEEESSAVPGFKKFCLELYPKKEKALLHTDIDSFSTATNTIAAHFEKFFQKVSDLPLLSVIVFWSENLTKDKSHAAKNAHSMQQLITHGYIGIKDTRGQPWTLKHMVSIGHDSIIEAIRCNEVWTIEKTEEYVQFYIDFVNWLSEKTFSYVPQATDPDLKKTKQRKISRDEFIAICKELGDRERVIAQLMYYGGTRTLEEILSIKIGDINTLLGHIAISDFVVHYPKHVLSNLQAYIADRNKGYVFIGRNKGDRIDGTVPYRSLKTAISKLGLDPSFTFKDFVNDI